MKQYVIDPVVYEQMIIERVKKELAESNSNSSRLNVAIDLGTLVPKPEHMPVLQFSDRAINKMVALVNGTADEVGWHCTVDRNKETNHYFVRDVYVYPQEVTGATCTATDDYGPWLFKLELPVFNTLRFQGHSHVNFGCTPSSVDLEYYKTILKDVEDFYIFFILNKRGDMYYIIYDIESNIVYEKADITVIEGTHDNAAWAKEMLATCFKRKTTTPSTITTPSVLPVHDPKVVLDANKAKGNVKGKGKDKDKKDILTVAHTPQTDTQGRQFGTSYYDLPVKERVKLLGSTIHTDAVSGEEYVMSGGVRIWL